MSQINQLGIDPKNFLKVASQMDRTGTKETILALDTSTNNFYLIDDDGNVNNISGWRTVTLTAFDSGGLLDAYIDYLDTLDPTGLKGNLFAFEQTYEINGQYQSSDISTAVNGIINLEVSPSFFVTTPLQYGKIETADEELSQLLVYSNTLFGSDNYVYREKLTQDDNPRYTHKAWTTSADGGYSLSIKIDWDDTVTVNWAFSQSGDIPA